MGNWLSNTGSEDQPPAQGDTRGDYSANSGCGNTFGSGNSTTTNNYYFYGSRSKPENYDKILQALYPPGSGYVSHLNRVQEPVEGTCTWVIEHPKYKEWLGNKTSGLLWLSADPGCGKSVIASFLVKHLKMQRNAIVCYFFFKDDSEEQRSATFALRAILHQLISQNNTLFRYAEEEFKAKGERFTGEWDTLWDILVKAVAEGGCGDVICVVDALDECGEETLTPLINRITRFPGSNSSDTPLKFLVTSRPYHYIEKGLGSRVTTIRLKGEDEVNAISEDVSRVIDNGIKELELLWGNSGGLGYLRDLLYSSADRTFLWISLVLELLKACEDDSPEEFKNIVSTTPHDLAQFYTKILDRSSDPIKARRILNIVVAAARPLTLQEMNTALRISQGPKAIKDLRDLRGGSEKTVKNQCGLFVRIIDSKIYLVHQTAREFLIRGTLPGRGNWQYTLCPVDSSFIMADICISYLSLEDFENDPLPIQNIPLTISSAHTQARLAAYLLKYPLLDYAASYWARHFRDSGDRQMELFESTSLICKVGSSRFQTWFRLYWDSSHLYYLFPKDFTHLMMASWLGQRRVVERLLDGGGDINARSEHYGTALTIAAVRKDVELTRVLVQRSSIADLGTKEFKILNTRVSQSL